MSFLSLLNDKNRSPLSKLNFSSNRPSASGSFYARRQKAKPPAAAAAAPTGRAQQNVPAASAGQGREARGQTRPASAAGNNYHSPAPSKRRKAPLGAFPTSSPSSSPRRSKDSNHPTRPTAYLRKSLGFLQNSRITKRGSAKKKAREAATASSTANPIPSSSRNNARENIAAANHGATAKRESPVRHFFWRGTTKIPMTIPTNNVVPPPTVPATDVNDAVVANASAAATKEAVICSEIAAVVNQDTQEEQHGQQSAPNKILSFQRESQKGALLDRLRILPSPRKRSQTIQLQNSNLTVSTSMASLQPSPPPARSGASSRHATLAAEQRAAVEIETVQVNSAQNQLLVEAFTPTKKTLSTATHRNSTMVVTCDAKCEGDETCRSSSSPASPSKKSKQPLTVVFRFDERSQGDEQESEVLSVDEPESVSARSRSVSPCKRLRLSQSDKLKEQDDDDDEDTVDLLRSKLFTIQRGLSDLEDERGELSQQCQDLQEEKEALQRELSRQQVEIASLSEQVGSQSDGNLFQSNQQRLARQVDELKAQLEKAEQEKQTALEECRQQRQVCDEQYQDEIVLLQQERDVLQRDYRALEKEHKNLSENSVRILFAKIQALQQEKLQLQHSLLEQQPSPTWSAQKELLPSTPSVCQAGDPKHKDEELEELSPADTESDQSTLHQKLESILVGYNHSELGSDEKNRSIVDEQTSFSLSLLLANADDSMSPIAPTKTPLALAATPLVDSQGTEKQALATRPPTPWITPRTIPNILDATPIENGDSGQIVAVDEEGQELMARAAATILEYQQLIHQLKEELMEKESLLEEAQTRLGQVVPAPAPEAVSENPEDTPTSQQHHHRHHQELQSTLLEKESTIQTLQRQVHQQAKTLASLSAAQEERVRVMVQQHEQALSEVEQKAGETIHTLQKAVQDKQNEIDQLRLDQQQRDADTKRSKDGTAVPLKLSKGNKKPAGVARLVDQWEKKRNAVITAFTGREEKEDSPSPSLHEATLPPKEPGSDRGSADTDAATAAKGRVDQLESDLESSRDTAVRLEMEKNDADAKVKQLRDQVTQQQRLIDSLQRELSQQAQTINNQINAREHDAEEQRYLDQERQNEQFLELSAQHEAALKELTGDYEDTFHELHAKLRQRDKEIACLQDEIALQLQKMMEMTVTLENNKEDVAMVQSLQRDIESIEAERALLAESILDKDTYIAELEADILKYQIENEFSISHDTTAIVEDGRHLNDNVQTDLPSDEALREVPEVPEILSCSTNSITVPTQQAYAPTDHCPVNAGPPLDSKLFPFSSAKATPGRGVLVSHPQGQEEGNRPETELGSEGRFQLLEAFHSNLHQQLSKRRHSIGEEHPRKVENQEASQDARRAKTAGNFWKRKLGSISTRQSRIPRLKATSRNAEENSPLIRECPVAVTPSPSTAATGASRAFSFRANKGSCHTKTADFNNDSSQTVTNLEATAPCPFSDMLLPFVEDDDPDLLDIDSLIHVEEE